MNPNRSLNEALAGRFTRWLLVQRYSACTRYRYPRTIRQFSSFIEPKKLLSVNHLDIQEFLARSAVKGATPRFVWGQLHALRVFFDFLNLGGLIKWVPPRMVKLRPLPRHTPKVLTNEQLSNVMGAASTNHERALVEVLYGTGCRTGELRTMRIENIDFEARSIRVLGKAGTRYLMFTATVGKALKTYLGKRKTG